MAAAYILSHEISRSIIILKKTHITTLLSKRSEAAMVGILSTNAITCSYTNPSILVVRAVDVQVQNVLARVIIVDNLGSFDDTVGAEISCFGGAGEKGTSVSPFDEIGGRVAVDVLEECAVGFVFADHVIGSIDLTILGQYHYNTSERSIPTSDHGHVLGHARRC